MYTKKLPLLFIALFLSLGLALQAQAVGARTLKLAVNDALPGIEAASVQGSYYVPLRDLAKVLDWTLTVLPDGIEVAGPTAALRLPAAGTVAPQDGSGAGLSTFLKDGRLMVPVKIAGLLGYTVSYKPEQYLLRVYDASAKLSDADFAARYQKELQPAPPPPPPAAKAGTTVYLTFDDGPSATTSKLLDILAAHDVKATFFMIGPHISHYPEQVKRIVKEGQGLGLHGMTHRKDRFYASPQAALAEMRDDNAVLKKTAGVTTTLIRTPYGSKPYFTKTFRDAVLSQGYHLWDWNVDSDDWKYKEDSDTIYRLVLDQVHKLKKSQTNPVILMHDQKATLKVLPQLLEELKKEGYRFEILTYELKPVNFWKDLR